MCLCNSLNFRFRNYGSLDYTRVVRNGSILAVAILLPDLFSFCNFEFCYFCNLKLEVFLTCRNVVGQEREKGQCGVSQHVHRENGQITEMAQDPVDASLLHVPVQLELP